MTTQHQIGSGKSRLKYTATTGRVVLREEVLEDGTFTGHKPRAQIFSTAYVLDDVDPRTRPVTFAFNGGPGSSSVWLHLGLLGPRRVVMGDVGSLAKPPYGLADNLESLLAVSDLVFIDPVTTGYSRTSEGHKVADFHGYRRDLESVGEFIRLWTSRNDRWLSPKFLAGESYGTTRAAALAAHLADGCGMYLNGLLLISSVLDIGSVDFTEGNDLPYALYLPTYTAAASYHGVIAGDLATLVGEAEEFAAGDLLWALARGNRLVGPDRDRLVRRYAALTGLAPDYVDRANLRVNLYAFATELLRSRSLEIGRLDLRFTHWMDDANASRLADDPSYRALGRPVLGRAQRLRPQRTGLRDRPVLQPAHRPGTAVVLPGVRGQVHRGGHQTGAGDARQPGDAGPRLVRLPRRGHAPLRRRARLRPPAHPGRGGAADRMGLLRGGTHDVRPRTDPAAAVGRPR